MKLLGDSALVIEELDSTIQKIQLLLERYIFFT